MCLLSLLASDWKWSEGFNEKQGFSLIRISNVFVQCLPVVIRLVPEICRTVLKQVYETRRFRLHSVSRVFQRDILHGIPYI